MYLTREEERILSGEQGEAKRLALSVVVKVAEALGANRLVRISHAHVSGASYSTIGEPGLEFLAMLRSLKARVSVPTTLNPIGLDPDDPGPFEVSNEYRRKQAEILSLFESMGVRLTLSCTPYLERKPRVGEHLAWGESSAVAYANTVCGARTNREGGPLALLAAIAGRTYEAGLHLDANRRPTVTVRVTPGGIERWDETFGGAMGATLAEELEADEVPYIDTRLPWDLASLKAFCASLGTYGDLAMCLIKGVSPEARPPPRIQRTLTLDPKELEARLKELDDVVGADAYFVGCPHASLAELEELADLLTPGAPRRGRLFMVATSAGVYEQARNKGLIAKLRACGVTVLKGTCPVVAPLRRAGLAKIVTNSLKAAFYLRRVHKVEVAVAPMREIAKMWCGGR